MKRSLVLSVADQAVVSAFNFALSLFLVRFASPVDFGVFAIIYAVSLFTAMIQNAVINTPLSVHLPTVADDTGKARLRRVFSAANLMISAGLLIASAAAMPLWLGPTATALGACVYLVAQFFREYFRSLLAVEGRLASLLVADIVCVALSVIALATVHWQDQYAWQVVPATLLIVGVAGTLSIVPCVLTLGSIGRLRGLAAEIRQVFAEQWKEIRWSLLGVITTEIQNRGYVYIAAAVIGPAAVAQLQAGRIFFGPLNLLTSAWARVARPQLAGLLARTDADGFDATLKRAVQAFALFNVVFLVSLWLAWQQLSSLVFGGKYEEMGIVVAAWGVANIAFQCRSCLGIGVQAMRRFRELSMATIAGATVSLVLTALACFSGKPIWFIAPVIAGECLAMAIVLGILRRRRAPLPAYTG